MKTLRLILTRKCNRNCSGCCNKQELFVEQNVPPFDENLAGYDEVIITGGEPLLLPMTTKAIAILTYIENPEVKRILYTADVGQRYLIEDMLRYFEGITITLHQQKDVDDFRRLNFWLLRRKRWIQDKNKTLRLNVFKGVDLYMQDSSLWKIKDNIEWIENCPLPENETIMELK